MSSLIASLLNGIFIIGGPADVYFYGLEGGWILVAWILLIPLGALVIVPTFYHMRLTSAYEVRRGGEASFNNLVHS